jgi:hypothetical protein
MIYNNTLQFVIAIPCGMVGFCAVLGSREQLVGAFP